MVLFIPTPKTNKKTQPPEWSFFSLSVKTKIKISLSTLQF